MAEVGRHNEALSQARLSFARDRYEPVKIGHLVRTLEALGKNAEADALYRQSLIWFPKSWIIFWERLSGMMERGGFESIELLEKQIGQENLPSDYEPIPRLIAAVKANSLGAVRVACPVQTNQESFKSIQCMLALARLGDLDRAFAFAGPLYPPRLGRTPGEEQALWLRQPWSTPTIFITSRAAAPMRRDPRYLELARRVGLLAYWNAGKLPDFCHQPQPEPICLRLKSHS